MNTFEIKKELEILFNKVCSSAGYSTELVLSGRRYGEYVICRQIYAYEGKRLGIIDNFRLAGAVIGVGGSNIHASIKTATDRIVSDKAFIKAYNNYVVYCEIHKDNECVGVKKTEIKTLFFDMKKKILKMILTDGTFLQESGENAKKKMFELLNK